VGMSLSPIVQGYKVIKDGRAKNASAYYILEFSKFFSVDDLLWSGARIYHTDPHIWDIFIDKKCDSIVYLTILTKKNGRFSNGRSELCTIFPLRDLRDRKFEGRT